MSTVKMAAGLKNIQISAGGLYATNCPTVLAVQQLFFKLN